MDLIKYQSGEILAHIKHDMRQLPENKSYGNESVDLNLSVNNYSLIDRGSTAAEINKYRKDFEKKCFKYHRINLVRSVEICIQCPSDCPSEQHEAFFQTAFDWYCDNYLPAGKDCVFVAQVHRDEHKFITIFDENGVEVQKDISKEHLHIMYVPAVDAGPKHPDFKYRLCADQLTKRAVLRDMHPSLQKELDAKGIKATVYRKREGDGNIIKLTVKQLKEITNRYGITIDHTLTVDELAGILQKNIELQKNEIVKKHASDVLTAKLQSVEQQLEAANKELTYTKAELQSVQHKQTVSVTNTENKDKKIETLQQQIRTLKEQLQNIEHTKEIELAERDKEIEKLKEQTVTQEQSREWGTASNWGHSQGWGGTVDKDTKTWDVNY